MVAASGIAVCSPAAETAGDSIKAPNPNPANTATKALVASHGLERISCPIPLILA
jgi:hypothetical protein